MSLEVFREKSFKDNILILGLSRVIRGTERGKHRESHPFLVSWVIIKVCRPCVVTTVFLLKEIVSSRMTVVKVSRFISRNSEQQACYLSMCWSQFSSSEPLRLPYSLRINDQKYTPSCHLRSNGNYTRRRENKPRKKAIKVWGNCLKVLSKTIADNCCLSTERSKIDFAFRCISHILQNH